MCRPGPNDRGGIRSLRPLERWIHHADQEIPTHKSFAVLVVAEMIGVKAGLGWYLQWAQGWAAYANMYAALIVMSLLCSGAITLLFRTRDRLLVWQKGVVKW